MKNSKVMLVVGAGAAVALGIYLYRKSKADNAVTVATTPLPEVQTNVEQIKLPVASDQLIINLPPALLQPSGNTGIKTPDLTKTEPAIPALQPPSTQAMLMANSSLRDLLRKPVNGLAGNSFILN